MKQPALVAVVLLLTLVWGVFSWRWYTCGVKGFCGNETAEQPIENPDPVPPIPPTDLPDLDDPKYWQKG